MQTQGSLNIREGRLKVQQLWNRGCEKLKRWQEYFNTGPTERERLKNALFYLKGSTSWAT